MKKRFDVREIKTSRDIDDWNAGRIPVAVIHPASAGHGLNLQAGGSTPRVVRPHVVAGALPADERPPLEAGQASQTVVIQHIVAKGTIDERIMKALAKKEMTQAALIDAVKAEVA